MQSKDYVIRFHDDPLAVDARDWNLLLSMQDEPTPFMRHEYLAALHASRSAVAEEGWGPRMATVHRGGQLVAVTPLYLKAHSYGEYVFDWAWADAYRRHGLAYYPKLLCAVPFTPVPGSRLLAVDDAARDALLQGLIEFARSAGLSSVHLLFLSAADRAACVRAGWMLRENVQFHWSQPSQAPWTDFEAFLSSLQRDKRKKIAQERRRVADAGIAFETFEGAQIDPELWDFFHQCYTLTYQAHGSSPYLTRGFFDEMARTMAPNWVMFVASRNGARIAASLVALDRRARVAYGRYWGATEHVPCLHFEACYYQPIQWCIAQGIDRFEGGAQGEHKMARGLLPVRTSSAHWLADDRFACAVSDFLEREGAGVEAYVDELGERNPFRRTIGTQGAPDAG